MEVALTFGSVGDIIQLCLIAKQLYDAIGVGCDGRGKSADQYRELRNDLNTLRQILFQVVTAYAQHEPSSPLHELNAASKKVVDQCSGDIRDTLSYFQDRYQESLRPEGSGNKVKDAFKKARFTREGDRIKVLQGKLRDGIHRLSLLRGLVVEKTACLNKDSIEGRIVEAQALMSHQTQGLQDEVKEILKMLQSERQASQLHTKTLDEVNQRLAVQNNQSSSILILTQDALKGLSEAKSLIFLVLLCFMNLRSFVKTSIGRALDPTKELPAMLEDALGREMPIPPQWLDFIEWPALFSLLDSSFKGRKGHAMVLRRRYTLEEDASKRDFDFNTPLHFHLRRGMKVNMSMVFDLSRDESGACPRCGVESSTSQGATVQCEACKMWFRVDITGDATIATSYAPSPDSVRKSTLYSPRQTSDIVFEPGDFTRVRLYQLKSAHHSYQVKLGVQQHHYPASYPKEIAESLQFGIAITQGYGSNFPFDTTWSLKFLRGQDRKRLPKLRRSFQNENLHTQCDLYYGRK